MLYKIFVPIRAFQEVLVFASSPEEAIRKVFRAEDVQEVGSPVFEEIDDQYEAAWKVEGLRQDVTVDLKWALWSSDREYWDERAPGVWEKLESLPLLGSVKISTAPRKEIRYGHVIIERVNDGYRASGEFWEAWDSPEELGFPVDAVPFAKGEPGVEREFDLSAPTLEELMRKIDAEEDSLIEASAAEYRELDELYGREK